MDARISIHASNHRMKYFLGKYEPRREAVVVLQRYLLSNV